MITRVNIHNFIGMNINVTKNRAVEISIKHQIEETIEMIADKLKGSLSLPATKKIVTGNPATNQLRNEKN